MDNAQVMLSILLFSLMGTYAFSSLVYVHCHFFAKIKGTGPVLVLCLANLIELFILYYIYSGASQSQGPAELLPFLAFLWLLTSYIYFGLMRKQLNIQNNLSKMYARLLSATIAGMGAISFFFGIDNFRKLFFVAAEALPESKFISLAANTRPTDVGSIIIILLGALVLFGHFYLVFNSFKKRDSRRVSGLFKLTSIGGVLVSIYDLATIMGYIDFLPLTGLIFIPLIAYLLFRLFSAPYFDAYGLGRRLQKGLHARGDENAFLKKKLNAKESGTIIHNILDFLTESYGESVSKTSVKVDDNFGIWGEKSELTILLYNLVEKAFECAKLRPDKKGAVSIHLKKEGATVLEILHNGPEGRLSKNDKEGDLFVMERSLAQKNGGTLKLNFKGEFKSFAVEFES